MNANEAMSINSCPIYQKIFLEVVELENQDPSSGVAQS